MPDPEQYPEHAKLRAAKQTDDATQLVGEFVDWLQDEKGVHLMAWRQGLPLPAPPFRDLMHEFFGVDPVKLEEEKRQMLEDIRAADETII